MLKFSEVVRTVYFDPLVIEAPDRSVSYTYRAEVLRTPEGQYRVRLYELEAHTMQPAFFEGQSTEFFWTESGAPIQPETILEPTPERALDVLTERLNELFASVVKGTP